VLMRLRWFGGDKFFRKLSLSSPSSSVGDGGIFRNRSRRCQHRQQLELQCHHHLRGRDRDCGCDYGHGSFPAFTSELSCRCRWGTPRSIIKLESSSLISLSSTDSATRIGVMECCAIKEYVFDTPCALRSGNLGSFLWVVFMTRRARCGLVSIASTVASSLGRSTGFGDGSGVFQNKTVQIQTLLVAEHLLVTVA
ncbi:17362_t:CDS:2, partial [Acaulospora morrowiae]